MTESFDELMDLGFAPHLLAGHMGVRVLSCANGKARLRMPFRSHYLQMLGVVQGGVIATLCDMTMGWSVLSVVHPRLGPTIDLSVSYLRSAAAHDLECDAVVLRAGRSIAHARAEVLNLDGVLIATASGSFLLRDRQ
ncbi:ABC transporter substrate-binding protein [Nocardioides sp. S5]|uniref:PaaI family thioesterase n=1 Tax=Nocardioides sp. S5 TaxID=2017486 RepID=UPI001A8FEB81|nr:PaaI family thioesterase [Nocardioides sp. S5]QSR32180.1 ABC transporter substrate-binding protein [Nocardioides sp. S5]